MQQDSQSYYQSIYWSDKKEKEINHIKNMLVHYTFEEIIEYLDYDNLESKAAAIRILGDTKAIETLPKLISMFYSTNNNLIKKELIVSLGKIKEPLAIEHLITDFDEQPYRLKISIIKSLALIGTSMSLDFFINALNDKDQYIRTALINAITVIGDENCINVIKNYIDDPSLSVSNAANEALYLIETGERSSIGKIKELSQDLSSVVSIECDNPYVSSFGSSVQKEDVGQLNNKDVFSNKTRPKIEKPYDDFNPGYHSTFMEKPKKHDDESSILNTISEISIDNKMKKISLDEPLLNKEFENEMYGLKQEEQTIQNNEINLENDIENIEMPDMELMDSEIEEIEHYAKEESIIDDIRHTNYLDEGNFKPQKVNYEEDQEILQIDFDKQFEEVEILAHIQEKGVLEKQVPLIMESLEIIEGQKPEPVDMSEPLVIDDGSLNGIDFPNRIEYSENIEFDEVDSDDIIESQQPEPIRAIEPIVIEHDESLNGIDFPNDIEYAENTKADEVGSDDIIESQEPEPVHVEEIPVIEETQKTEQKTDEVHKEIESQNVTQPNYDSEDHYIKMLSSNNLRDRRQAIKELSKSSSTEVFNKLIDIAYNDISLVRKDAIKTLAQLPNDEKFNHLIKFLSDEKWYIREEAARALGKLAHKGAYDNLQKLLKDENKWVKETAIKAMATINLNSSIEQIKGFIDSPELNIKLAAENVMRVYEKSRK